MQVPVKGQIGANQLLAQLLTTIPDPGGDGIGVNHISEVEGGVAAEVRLPSGDKYLVIVQWSGDQEATPGYA